MRQSRSPRNTSDDNLLYQNELYLGCLQSLYNLTLSNMRGERVKWTRKSARGVLKVFGMMESIAEKRTGLGSPGTAV